jgi:hypothetical protein
MAEPDWITILRRIESQLEAIAVVLFVIAAMLGLVLLRQIGWL